MPRVPTLFLPHGGGPWPFVDMGFGAPAELEGLRGWLASVPSIPAQAPRALLVISAHWEEDQPTLMTAEKPGMLYDYYGFPPASYQLTWPAPGAPELVERVAGLLRAGGFGVGLNPARGFDHGTFHNLRAFGHPDAPRAAAAFDAWLRATTLAPRAEREEALIAWASAPFARFCHPREEHLLPLLVCAGAGLDDAGSVPYARPFFGVATSAHQFG